jgi:hypothetical protein
MNIVQGTLISLDPMMQCGTALPVPVQEQRGLQTKQTNLVIFLSIRKQILEWYLIIYHKCSLPSIAKCDEDRFTTEAICKLYG